MYTDKIREILRSGGVENFQQESRWIVAETAGESAAVAAAQRRAAGEPLQYILGTAEFRYLTLDVDHRVLIPRPETESLVEWVLKCAPQNAAVLDLGCGSGAIALSLAHERCDLRVTAADYSVDALDVAKHNAEKCKLSGKVEFVHTDLFSNLTGRKFDIIAANLPYVTEAEYGQLDAEVRDFEPFMALVAPEEGLQLIFRTIAQLDEFLTPGGAAIFELSPPQADITASELQKHGFKSHIELDLCGRKRFVCGER